MKIYDFEESNMVATAPPGHEGSIADLPVAKGESNGFPTVTSCWKPTDEEWEEMRKTGRVWVTVLGNKMPPIYVNGHNPFVQGEESE